VLEVGCGAGNGGRWVVSQGARVIGIDLSAAMLAAGKALDAQTGHTLPTAQADAAELPFRSESFDVCFSAFGALPFVPEPARVLSEMARVLRPGGRVVCSVVHPVRWMFPDDGGPEGLRVTQSYFDRRAYVEEDASGQPVYVEHHRTVSDWVRDWTDSGLVLDRLVEPEWVDGALPWGAWTPERGALMPGTLILQGHRSAAL
jgi:SAM-dependent methyltransferase